MLHTIIEILYMYNQKYMLYFPFPDRAMGPLIKKFISVIPLTSSFLGGLQSCTYTHSDYTYLSALVNVHLSNGKIYQSSRSNKC